MTHCPSCHTQRPDDSTSCPACGAFPADSPTRRLDSPKTPRIAARTSYDSIDNARFVPGTMLAERYRIVGLLGKGGMGEVYRADDLKLGQPVALKFLPDHLLSDAAALARFHREVRVARQVSHRNVCRVYDIGEVEGRHYLTMEYIKGEELSSLLRRIGRLPVGKAVQLARQICAGLSAAHEVGVLHRDLKPANVMIDGEGNARILDFGLAGLTEEFGDDEARAGTPAYMSPEQIEGRDQTVRSDIYSLGLLLYELFTGKRAFEAPSLNELMKLRLSDTSPTSPTSIVSDLDPVIEKVIDRCIQWDPARRPVSALQVAAALPGGDPIAAALAAGETPSPEMVAAAPKEGSLRPMVAVTLLAGVIIGVALLVFLSDKLLTFRNIPFDKSPEVLADRAHEIIKRVGYTNPPVDRAYGFSSEPEHYRFVVNNDHSMTRWDKLKTGQPALVSFWYRQSPRHLEPQSGVEVTRDDPSPLLFSGMASVRLDTTGRLIELQVVPPQLDPVSPGPSSVPQSNGNPVVTGSSQTEAQSLKLENPSIDWSVAFNEAGLNQKSFKPTEPLWLPPVYSDSRLAWEGSFPDVPSIPLRVEAASYRGAPVYFKLIAPWDKPDRMNPFETGAGTRRLLAAVFGVFVMVLLAGIWLARRNLKLGRGDRSGAFKLALFVFLTNLLGLAIAASHVPTFAGEIWLLNLLVGACLLAAAVIWLIYIALEPSVRRRTPNRIISWSRLLAGSLRDPMVGRDVLIGVLLGLWVVVFSLLAEMVGRWLNIPPDIVVSSPLLKTITGFRGVASIFLTQQPAMSLLHGLGFTFLLLLFSLLLRTERRAAVAVWAVFFGVFILAGEHPLRLAFDLAITIAYVAVAARYGLLAITVAQFSLFMSGFYPYTLDFSVWYAGTTIFALLVLVGLAVYGFHTSLAGQRLFSAHETTPAP